jgi:hypothetical protein
LIENGTEPIDNFFDSDMLFYGIDYFLDPIRKQNNLMKNFPERLKRPIIKAKTVNMTIALTYKVKVSHHQINDNLI